MANVLKVFLENGQTKSFKYDSTTTVQVILRQQKLKFHCAQSNFFLISTIGCCNVVEGETLHYRERTFQFGARTCQKSETQ